MTKYPKKLVCFHRLDDYSGSPLVLSNLIKHWVQNDRQVELYTATKGREGFLSEISGVTYYHVPYKKFSIKLFTLFYFLFSQLQLFFRLFKYRNEQVIFYVNTLVPFAAAIVGKLMKKKVIYHIHEVSISPIILNNFLKKIAYKTASDAIFVSNYVKEQFNFNDANTFIVYNALSKDFLDIVKGYEPAKKKDLFQILMICSLKDFKGIWEFIELSKLLVEFRFELVVNASLENINHTFSKKSLPNNLHIYPATKNVHEFYQRADLLLNLSHTDKWIETFGLTVLEAMHYGKPAIVPTIGGITELIDDNVNGYKIDVKNLNELKDKILFIAENQEHYDSLSLEALKKSKSFNFKTMVETVDKILDSLNV